ncbi:hypothetical protein KVF89_07245 [Nocardioides carbamazepini]|jgi:hypothetical protein|uniref:hypothetical protein n=1 Tax=Nocardioides carbamazepini TaxID=2854259 RepID=UPI00214A4E89|nr:hypothetical protein [Nocardioides carbamazepini]MCR1782323.1 hypothetical protein [Nocardioides carbamazepini]
MARLVPIRSDDIPRTLLVLREGTNTLSNDSLAAACERAHAEIGMYGFSVLEVPGGGFAELARLRPLLRVRRKVMLASGRELIDDGFPLVPTFDHPHWTVVVPAPEDSTFERIRALFSAPVDNPAFDPGRA